ncbi:MULTISPECIES: 4'-phosphopantetheinyl transferase family protein [Streptomyces]|uniref:4'-phosphopantetheinyl transferase family protein n=1 Tax=Streptomyces TaxID=1883 RepID=UPI000C3AE3FF|nr:MULTISPECIES: 4'-phosphopantetheinyl transferase superfamily protein [Streptomyces]PIB12249.1 hypothetical protein B1C81_03625 [Streptomyces sp. HG99]
MELWLISPGSAPDSRAFALDELDEHERRRARTFRRPADRTLYVAAHIALRRVLAPYVGAPARELVFGRADCPRCGGPHGRPVVEARGPVPHFSLSHSHGRALIAVSARPVGADVERVPGPERVDVCLPSLHPYEQAQLTRLQGPERQAGFARIWARKEAYLKGTGAGIGRWMSEVYVGDGAQGAPRGPDGWTVRDVPCPAGHAAAVAVRGAPPTHIVVRELPLEALLVTDQRLERAHA